MTFNYTFKKKTGHLRIEEGSTEIPELEFAYRPDIKKITIPDSVTTIGNAAFYQCSIKKVDIPESVAFIGYYALARNLLKSIDIPDSVTSIGKNAFWDNNISKAKLSNSLTSLEKYIFADNEIQEISIPDSVLKIEEGAFSNNSIEQFNFPESLTTIGIRAFAGNFLSDFAVPDSIESISEGAFENNSISKVILPDSFKKKDLPLTSFDSNVQFGFDCDVALSINSKQRELNEGQNMDFTVFACAFPVGTILYWDISGPNIDQDDFDTRPMEGFRILDATQKFRINFATKEDDNIEGTESYRLRVYADSQKSNLISQSKKITILDTTEEPPEDSSPDSESESNANSDSNPDSESESDANSDSNPDSESESDASSDSNPDSESESDANSDSNPDSDSESDASSDSNPDSESDANSDSNPESDSDANSDSNPESESGSNSDSNPESESGSNSELNDSSPGGSSDSLEADNIIFSIQGKGKLKGSKGIDEFRFDIFDEFKKKKADKIKGFKPEYDFLTFTNRSIPQLTEDAPISFATAKNRKSLIRLSKKNYDFIYYKKKGRLYWDSNGSDKKWGDPNEGGLIAILKGKPELNLNDILIS